VYLVIIFVNKQRDAQFFFIYVYFYSLHISGMQKVIYTEWHVQDVVLIQLILLMTDT